MDALRRMLDQPSDIGRNVYMPRYTERVVITRTPEGPRESYWRDRVIWHRQGVNDGD